MRPTINHLIQLQELVLIRDEQKSSGGGAHLERLNASITEMTKELPAAVRSQFEKLHQRNSLVIVPISDSTCSVCGMRLPISQVQAVRHAKQIFACPNCARMLFYPETTAKRVGAKYRRTGPRKVGISRFSSHSLMVPRLESTDAEGVIGELAFKMAEAGFVDNAEHLVEEALRREAILSTAVDHGLAFPHVRGVEGGGLTLALGMSPKGLKFDGPAKTLTRIVFFLVIPTAASAFHLKLLAGLTETCRKPEARKALLAESDPEKLWKALCKVTRSTIK